MWFVNNFTLTTNQITYIIKNKFNGDRLTIQNNFTNILNENI